MNEENATSGGVDQPLVRPPDEDEQRDPPGVRPSVASELRAMAQIVLEARDGLMASEKAHESDIAAGCAVILMSLADKAERERWTREHDRTA